MNYKKQLEIIRSTAKGARQYLTEADRLFPHNTDDDRFDKAQEMLGYYLDDFARLIAGMFESRGMPDLARLALTEITALPLTDADFEGDSLWSPRLNRAEVYQEFLEATITPSTQETWDSFFKSIGLATAIIGGLGIGTFFSYMKDKKPAVVEVHLTGTLASSPVITGTISVTTATITQ